MAFMRALSTTASALTAQRFRMDVLAENIASATVTRTATGEPYRRRNVTLAAADDTRSFSSLLRKNRDMVNNEYGVKVTRVIEDQSPFKLVFDPNHPDADAQGYVRMPNVDTLRENVDMLATSQAYSANITAFNVTKSMITKAMEIGR